MITNFSAQIHCVKQPNLYQKLLGAESLESKLILQVEVRRNVSTLGSSGIQADLLGSCVGGGPYHLQLGSQIDSVHV